MRYLLWLFAFVLPLFATGENQRNSDIWGVARITNINLYDSGFAPLWLELQGKGYFAYALAILVLAVIVVFALHYIIVGAKVFSHHGQKIYVFNAITRAMHALAAISWMILVPTGAIMMWGESFGSGAFVRFCKNAHGIATIVFCICVLPLFFGWLKRMLPKLYDIKWALVLGGYLSKEKRPVDSGKFNMGQKSWFWVAIPGGVLMIITGASMYFMDFGAGSVFGISQIEYLRACALIHNALGVLCAVFFLIHLYMVLFVIKGAIGAMIHGYKEEEEIYILHHHWYKELRKKGKIERSKYEDTYGTL